jgi:zinc transport system ATP-binding protein
VSDRRSLVAVERINFSYGTTRVLEDVSFPVEEGDFLALIGPNGSGKTTLLRIILGLLHPSSGTVRLLGEDIRHFSSWDQIAYVPQRATHFDPLFPVSVREVVAMGLLSRKRFPKLVSRRDEALILRALERVDMERHISRRIGELSGGQQQRVFIARAIVNNPRLLFLDEPATGIDAESQARFYDLLDELNRHLNITIVLITHDIGILTKHVNRVACLNQRLVFHGNHEEFCSSSIVQELLRGEYHLICHHH